MTNTTEQDTRPESLAERRRAALRMRITGATYAEIAEHHGHSTSRAHADVMAAMAEFSRDTPEQVLGRQLSMLADMRAAMWSAAMDGDSEAITAVLAIMDHEARLLGLYAPVKTAITTERLAPADE